MATRKYDGSICEIIVSRSDSLIARVHSYTPTTLIIVPRRNGVSLCNLKINTQVVVHIGSSKEKFIAVRGVVKTVSEDEVCLSSLEVITSVNNRNYARVAVNIKAELILNGSDTPKEVRIKDISLSGLAIECEFALGGVGALFTLILDLPDNRKQLRYSCVVRRILPDSNIECKKYGCSFIFKDTDNTDTLWKFIQDQILLGVK